MSYKSSRRGKTAEGFVTDSEKDEFLSFFDNNINEINHPFQNVSNNNVKCYFNPVIYSTNKNSFELYDEDIKNRILKITELGYTILKKHGFSIKKFRFDFNSRTKNLTEIHYIYGNKESYSHPFIKHKDDYGGVSGKVETIIFYLRNSFDGGDLDIEGKKYDARPSDDGRIKYICLSGDLLHTVTDMKSAQSEFCSRLVIVCQFEFRPV